MSVPIAGPVLPMHVSVSEMLEKGLGFHLYTSMLQPLTMFDAMTDASNKHRLKGSITIFKAESSEDSDSSSDSEDSDSESTDRSI